MSFMEARITDLERQIRNHSVLLEGKTERASTSHEPTSTPHSDSDPIENLNLRNRTRNCLLRHEITTIQQVTRMRWDELYELRGMGLRLMDDLQNALAARGLALIDSEPKVETK